MLESNDHKGDPAETAAPTPWEPLLAKVGQDARSVAGLVMADSVLADSIMLAISAFVAQQDKLSVLREQFAEADSCCRDLRQAANELMASPGGEHGRDQKDIGTAYVQLLQRMKDAGEKAAAINKMRSEADKLAEQLLNRAVDEIALCASIVVLRETDQYNGEGEAFCVAYIATFVIRENVIADLPASKAITTMKDWLKYSISAKNRSLELDFYARNRIAASIGNGMGLISSSELRIALIEAMQKMILPDA